MGYHYILASMGDMQPLEYKIIGSEQHLTFNSIRRLVLHELSDLSERDAKKHIEDCFRCKSIHESLTSPSEIRKIQSQNRIVPTMIGGVILVVILIGLAASFLYFGSSSKELKENTVESTSEFQDVTKADEMKSNEQVAQVLEASDTLSQINDEPSITDSLTTNKQFDQYIEKELEQPSIKLRGIYGKITGNGQPLPGVTIRGPGSRKARISDVAGKYYIQVPRNTRSLVFIYQGRQLVKQLDPQARRLDIHLRTESMTYPDSANPETSTANNESE